MHKKPLTKMEELKSTAISRTKVFTNSVKMAALTINNIIGQMGIGEVDVKTLHEQIDAQVSESLKGDTCGYEVMLCAQAKSLDTLFNHMVSRALVSKDVEMFRAYMEIAFKAQNQGRKTILGINSLKNPVQQTIVRQQNVALTQQVNNAKAVNFRKKNLKNELIREEKYEAMDFGGTLKTGSVNQDPETVEMVYRSKGTSR
jgi:hypothetical protein